MSSLSEKGKSGGKKLSADEQLLALQDALTLGVSELQLAARRLGDHWITMSTGTNQEKRGAKEAYAKVKVEVATLEAEVEELKDVLQVLKASKADKEALEGGDINSILFASAGSGGGGSGGGAGPSKSSSSGVDSGGNHEVTFKSKARLKSVLKLDVEMSTSVWEVINFISNFEIKMRSHKVSKGDQKIYLLEALKPGVVRALDMRGVDNSLMDELFEEVRRKVLGYNYLNLILDDWQRVFQKEEERVVDFKVRVCTYLRALGIDVVQKPEDQKRIIAELRKKFQKTLVEVFEGGGRNILDISWVTLWKELETLESSFFYLQHLKLLKIQAVLQPSSRGDGGGKGKNRGSAAEREKGQGRGRGGGDSGQTIHCFRCGQGGHMANACNHPKVKDIPKNVDGTWPRICHHCFKAGHLRSKCPDLGRKPAAAGGSYYVEVCSQDLGWVGAVNLPEEDLPGEEGVSQEEILNFWRGDGGGDAKQESGDFCGWLGEIPTSIILLKDRLIGDKRGEEFLEGEKEGISFSSPEIPRGGNEEGENFVGMVEGKREISSSPSEGENFVGMVEGKREISSSPPGGESLDRGGDFSKEEFSPTTERGGSEGGGSSLGKELPELSGGEGSPHSEAALRRVRVAEAEALRRAKGRTPRAPLIPYFLTAGGQEIVGLLDTGSSHFLVKKEIFEKMEGKEVVAPTSYKGVEGGVVQQQKGKLVKCQTCFGETDYIAYPQLAQLAVEALVPLQIGLAMGLEVKRVPKYWISKLQKSNDRKWVQSVRERLKETKFLKAQREFVLNRIERALRENSKLPPNTRCNLPNSSFRIELKEGVVASNHCQYLIPEAMIPKVKERCGEWVENQWVVLLPAGERNDWSSPLLAVNKVSGGVVALGDICLCMDFRRVNKLTKEPTFIIPLLKEMLGRLVGLKIFSELDLVNAYHQVNLDEDSYLLTGFIIPGSGAACWRVLFFGPKGAVTHFQKVVERVVGEVSIDIVIVIYVDNILVGSKDVESHVKELNMVIHALTKAGFKLKPLKCKITYLAIQFMGAVVDGDQRGVCPLKVEVFAKMQRPRTGKEVQKVLGFVNFLRDFIPLYSCVVGPLKGLRSTKKIDNDLWLSSGGKKAFDLAKEILSRAPVLSNPDWSKEFFVETDASQFGVGAVLFQKGTKGEVNIYIDFATKAFNSSQQNYSAVKRELLAGMFALERWRPFLLFRKFYWGMDNKALTYLNDLSNRMVLDWLGFFQEYDFETRFKRGVLNVLPHELSHMYSMLELDHGLKKPGLGDGGGCSLLTELCRIVRGTGSGVRQATCKFLQEKLDKVRPATAEERKEILSSTHAESHMGENMLFNMIWEDGYWWETLWKECKKLTCSCKECMFFNIGRKGFHPVSTIRACRPMDHVIYDFIGKLRVSERGYCFILIMVCVMTRFVFLKPLRTKSAKEVAFTLVNVFANFGVPQILQSDNEQVMVADVLEELRKLGGFQLRRIMKYFPRQNGVVERFVQETKQVLLKWAKGDFSGWEYYIPAIQMGLNDCIISRHRSRPFSVRFDEERGGYSLQEMDGRLLKDLSPIKHLKVVEKALDKEQAYEVEKIVGHRGGVNDREYQIKWKGYDELSWERREMFNEVKIIEDYWSKLKKQGGNKGPKGKEKE